MTAIGWIQIVVFFVLVLALTRPLGAYMFRVFEGDGAQVGPFPVLGRLERWSRAIAGVSDAREQTWQEYALSLLLFSAVGLLVTYGIERLQSVLPLNPQRFDAVPPALAWNTAASFVTNTNWQSYSGESTMSYATQMLGLAWHNFTSAATGMGVALAVARGFVRRAGREGTHTLGNFWVDVIRATLYVLLPLSFIIAVVFVSQGVIQSFAPYHELLTVEGAKQLLPMGPVASQEAIKMLGTNGGGFFNANSAHPFENPTPLTNLVQMLAIFAIPAGLTHTYGRMARDTRQGWALLAAMSVLFFVGVLAVYHAEAGGNPALAELSSARPGAIALGGPGAGHGGVIGNMEGKELRFGVAASSLFTTVTTDASCGAVNAMHDSYTPLGGLVPMVNIQLGEIIFGGVGAGLYGILVFVVLTVFIAGLMVGRTPEYLGKKIEAREMKLAMLYVLIFPLVILGFSGWAAVRPEGLSSLANAGPHGLSEILYAFSSGAGNNGSAFAGLSANTGFWNVALGVTMLVGRFFMIVPVLAIAGSMVGKKSVAPGPGTFPTDGPLFVILLLAVVVIVGALTFFPALALSPILEHFLAAKGELF